MPCSFFRPLLGSIFFLFFFQFGAALSDGKGILSVHPYVRNREWRTHVSEKSRDGHSIIAITTFAGQSVCVCMHARVCPVDHDKEAVVAVVAVGLPVPVPIGGNSCRRAIVYTLHRCRRRIVREYSREYSHAYLGGSIGHQPR